MEFVDRVRVLEVANALGVTRRRKRGAGRGYVVLDDLSDSFGSRLLFACRRGSPLSCEIERPPLFLIA